MVSIDGRGDGKSLIRARGLGKTYRRGGEEIHVLQGLNLDVDPGDFVAFMGPSGSGKITVLTAFQNVELPLLLTSLSKAERRRHVETALAVVGLGDRMHHYPRQLSGGQEQRVGIARAIVADPTFLLCDEPTGDLDRKSADEVVELLDRLVREYGKTVLMVTHDPLAAQRAHVTRLLEKGALVDA